MAKGFVAITVSRCKGVRIQRGVLPHAGAGALVGVQPDRLSPAVLRQRGKVQRVRSPWDIVPGFRHFWSALCSLIRNRMGEGLEAVKYYKTASKIRSGAPTSECEALRQAVADSVSPAMQDINLRAFDRGFEYGEHLIRGVSDACNRPVMMS